MLVNNAGFGPAGTIEEGGVGALEYCFGTNTWGPVKVTNAVVPFMRGKGSGMIVFIGSRSAYKTGPPVSLACPNCRYLSLPVVASYQVFTQRQRQPYTPSWIHTAANSLHSVLKYSESNLVHLELIPSV